MDEKLIKKYYEANPQGIPGTPDIPEIWEMHELFRSRVKAQSPSILLEAGCGKGYLGESLSNYSKSYHGVDISRTAIDIAKDRVKRGQFLVGTLRALPYPDDFADCLVCSEVLEHVPDHCSAINELARVTKPDKRILVSTPNSLNPDMIWRRFRKGKYTSQIYDMPVSYRVLLDEFGQAGLDIEEFFSFFHLPPFGESLPRAMRLPMMRVQERLSRYIHRPLGLYLFFVLRKRGRK